MHKKLLNLFRFGFLRFFVFAFLLSLSLSPTPAHASWYQDYIIEPLSSVFTPFFSTKIPVATQAAVVTALPSNQLAQAPVTSPTPASSPITYVSSSTPSITDQALLSLLEKLLNRSDIREKLRGPQGLKGDPASSAMYIGQVARNLQEPSAPAAIPQVFIPSGIVYPTASSPSNFGGATLFGVTNLSSGHLSTGTANVTDLTVVNSTTIGGSLSVTGNATIPNLTATTSIFNTSLTTPLVLGGTAVDSALTLQSTSGVGTTDFINFKVGNNGGTEAMRILSNGNVGIGTTDPIGTALGSSHSGLQIDRDGGSAAILLRSFRDAGNHAKFWSYAARGTKASPVILNSGDAISEFIATGYDGANYHDAARILMSVDSSTSPGLNDMPSMIIFETTPDGSTTKVERMRINQAGYVGIGTTTPSAKLHVDGSDAAISVTGSLGSELVSNGSFTSNLTGWSGTNWSWSAGTALHTAGSTAELTQAAMIPTDGDTYKITYTVVRTAGSVSVYLGGIWGPVISASGTYTEYITAMVDSPLLFKPTSAFDGSIDDVSVKKITTSANSKIETEVDFVKEITIHDRINFPDGHPIAIGYEALLNSADGTYNIPSSNICIGYYCGRNNTVVDMTGQITAVGYQAGLSFRTGSLTAFGKNAGVSATSEAYQSFFGNYAGASAQSGRQSCFGDESCGEAVTNEVTAFGGYACHMNAAGDCDAFGLDSQRYGTAGVGNASFGRESLLNVTSSFNSVFGYKAGRSLLAGTPLTAFGYQAGYYVTSGGLIAIGKNAGVGTVTSNAPATDTGGILIGDNANRSVSTGTTLTNYIGIGDGVLIDKSNQVKLGNSSITETVLYGNVIAGTQTTVPLILGGTSTSQDLTFQTTSGVGATGADMHFLVGNNGATEAMTILNNGNVGMGTSSPASKLDVYGRVVMIGDTEASANNRTDATNKWGQVITPHYTNAEEPVHLIAGYNSSSDNGIYIGGGVTASYNAATSIYFSTAANNTTTLGTQRMVITSAGNVGIGTTNPGGKLEVAGGQALFADGTAALPGLSFKSDPDTGFLKEATDRIALSIAGTIRVYIDSARIQNMTGATNNPSYSFSAETNTGMWYGGTQSLAFSTNGTEKMRILSGGNVGIGTTGPADLLHLTTGNLRIGASTATRATTAGTNQLILFDGTAPVGTLTNGISLYSTAGEAYIMDAAGNATLQSPHENENNYWVFDSKNAYTGKSLVVDMELMMKQLNAVFGWDFIHETIDGVVSSPATLIANTFDLRIDGIEERLAALEVNSGSSNPSIFSTIISWLSDAGNGIVDLYASVIHSDRVDTKKVNTDELCSDDICINKDQLKALLIQAGGSSSNNTTQSSSTPPSQEGEGGEDNEDSSDSTTDTSGSTDDTDEDVTAIISDSDDTATTGDNATEITDVVEQEQE